MDIIDNATRAAGVVPDLPPGSDLVTAILAALDKAPQGVVVVDVQEKILAANESAHTMFGYTPGQLAGQPLSSLLPTSAGPQGDLLNTLWRSSEGRLTVSRSPVIGVRKDGGAVPLEVGAGLLVDGHTYCVVASMVDISERLDLEARLLTTSNEQLGFQRLIADMASRLVQVPPDDVDTAINEGLREVGEALQVDSLIVWQAGRGESAAVASHYWVAAPHASPPEPYLTADLPWVFSNIEAAEACWFTRIDDVPDAVDRETLRRQGPLSKIVFPLTLHADGHRMLGALAISCMSHEREWVPSVRERLRLVAGVVSQALARKGSQMALDEALQEIRHLNSRLADGRDRGSDDGIEMRREVKLLRSSRPVVSESQTIKRALAQVDQVAPTPATVLLLGETGAGKDVFAQAIHDLSPRHPRHMVRVSCAAIPPALIESELFGRERGAYTGALSRQMGRFEAANQSTLFLDEIGDLPLEVQVKLLRVLQERVIERLGSTQQLKVDVRIIAATNRNLEQAVTDGTFREDLFYRLNVFPIIVPPLRERVEDIPGLVWAFIDEFSRLFGKRIESVSKDSLRELQGYSWPGNVRELRNVIERAVILAAGPHLAVQAPKPSVRAAQTAQTLEALEIRHIRSVLESTNWRVRGRGGAAERLGLKPTTLESRMARLGITRKKAS
jgi:formate hydrogenlyase transcriptional activator